MDNPDQAYTGRRRTRRSNRCANGRANGRADGRADRRAGSRNGWQPDWQDIQTNLPPLTPLSADQLAAIHQASLQLLEDYGIELMSADARARFLAAGADVDLAGHVGVDQGGERVSHVLDMHEVADRGAALPPPLTHGHAPAVTRFPLPPCRLSLSIEYTLRGDEACVAYHTCYNYDTLARSARIRRVI